MARYYTSPHKKNKVIDELWKIVVDYNKGKDGVNATHKINAILAINKMLGYNEAEKTESTIKDMTIKLKF
jgi:hypothetical protein